MHIYDILTEQQSRSWLLNRRNAATLEIRFIFVIVNLFPDFQYQVESEKQRKCSVYYYSDKISLNYHFISLMISTIYSLQLSWIWGKVGYYYNKIQHTTIINYYVLNMTAPPPSFLFDSWLLICFPMSGIMHHCLSLLTFPEGLISDFLSTVYIVFTSSIQNASNNVRKFGEKTEVFSQLKSVNNCVYWNKTLAVTSQIWPQ